MKKTLLILVGSFSMMLYAQSITPGTITNPGSNWCPGDYVIVPYTIAGTFNPGNMFILQMSDPGGSTFTSPINIDTIISTTNGTFNCIIPMGTAYDGFSFRIIASNPAVTSTTSNTILVQLTPPLNILTTGPFCFGQSFMLSADLGGDWYGPNGLIATFTFDVIINNPTMADTGIYYISFTNAHGCNNKDTVNVTFSPPPIVNFSYPGNDTVCIGYGVQVLTGGTPAGGIYSGPGVSGNDFYPGWADTTAQNNIVYTYYNGACWGADTVAITVLGCAGIDESFSQRINVYPNPFTNSITVTGIEKSTEVKLFNAIGEVIRNWITSENNHTINTEELRDGVYLLRIGNITRKIIKH